MSHPSVLILEDSPDLGEVFSDAFMLAGYQQIEVVMSGTDALAILEDDIPDVMLLDMHLPGMSGVEVLRTLRADERYNEMMIIIATADGQLAQQIGSEADFALVKPVSLEQLRGLAMRLAKR